MQIAGRLLKNVRYRGLSTANAGQIVAAAWANVPGEIITGLQEEGVVCYCLATGQAVNGMLDIRIMLNGDSIHIGDPFRISCDVNRPDMVQPAGGNFPFVYVPPQTTLTVGVFATSGAPLTVHLNIIVACWYGKDWDEAVPTAVCFPTEVSSPLCNE